MGNMLLQEKIDSLYSLADRFLHIGDQNGYVYADDLSLLNKSIHTLINELYPQRGVTLEQEAALCLAILMGYSVSIYANPDDEFKKQEILNRSRSLFDSLTSSPIKEQLFTIYNEIKESNKIN